MSVAILPLLGAGGMALSAMAKAVQALYGMAVDLNRTQEICLPHSPKSEHDTHSAQQTD